MGAGGVTIPCQVMEWKTSWGVMFHVSSRGRHDDNSMSSHEGSGDRMGDMLGVDNKSMGGGDRVRDMSGVDVQLWKW